MESFKPRFVIRRHPVGRVIRWPWVLKDRERPAFLGQYATQRDAILATARITGAEWEAAARVTA